MSKNVSIYSLFGTNREAEENGRWFELGPEIAVKVRRFKSRAVTAKREALEKPYEHLRRKGNIPAEYMEEILHKTLAEAVIVDWKGFFDTAGNPIPFSAEAADKLLRDLPELRDNITALSISMDNFRDESDKSTLGN